MNYAAETSLGAVTIRAFDMTERFFQKFLKLIDTDASLFFNYNATTEWFTLRIEILQHFTLFTVAFLLVLLPQSQTTKPGKKNPTRTQDSIFFAYHFLTV